MEKSISPIDLQHAWQTAFQLRTCPDDSVLRVVSPDENLSRHLAGCAICRQKRDMPAAQVNAWQKLFNQFAPLVHQAVNTPQSGQVWILKKMLSCWSDDGFYYTPPNILILEKLGDKPAFRVAQLYLDKQLMGEGDIWLGDRFGFAQSWNTYDINADLLECWLGSVSDSLVSDVTNASKVLIAQPMENSILSFFRNIEVSVGFNTSAQLSVGDSTESSQNEAFLQKILGTLAEVYDKVSNFKLPEYADSLIDLLAGTTDPNGISPVVAATSIPLQINIIIKQVDGTISIKTVGATLIENNWEDGDYYIAGKLNEIQQDDLSVVASLNVKGNVVCECQSTIEKGTPYFDIVFKSVPEEASSIKNMKYILVKL